MGRATSTICVVYWGFDVKAIILAAGSGSRLAPLTDDRPKCLVPVKGTPMLAWQVRALRAAGVSDISVVAGYRADQIEHEATQLGLRTYLNPRYDVTNMVYSLFCAADALNDDVIVSYADIVYG